MTQDSGSERPQRTVAELLAEYGGASGDAPRRRRRRAEDDGDSAPQTIIERVLSDSGKLLPIRDDQPPPEPPRRGGGHRSGEHRPVAQQPPAARPQQPGPGQPGPAQPGPGQPGPAAQPQAMPPAGIKPGGLPPAGPGGKPAGGPPGPPPSGQPTAYAEPVRPPGPPTGRAHLPPPTRTPGPPSQQSGQFPTNRSTTSRSGLPPVGPPTTAVRPVQQPGPGGPVPGPPSRPGMNPVPRNPAMGARPPGGPQRPQGPSLMDDMAATAVHPTVPDDFADFPQQPPTVLQQPVAAPRPGGGLPQEALTEEFSLLQGEPSKPLRPAPPGGRPGMPPGPTQLVQPVGPPGQGPMPPGRRPPPAAAMESTQAHAGPYVEDSDPGFPPVDVDDELPNDAFPSRDDFDRDDFADLDSGPVRKVDFDDVDDGGSASPGREWVLMGAQVGVGAIAGAAVWLAFSWLWGLQPVVAVVAALLVIVGLVLGVRRWRRADDLQTTVLAILAGLVVTVSPAALLLLHR